MKKRIIIIVEILLAFALSVLIACSVMGFKYAAKIIELCDTYLAGYNYNVYNELVAYYDGNLSIILSYSIPTLIAAVAVLAAMIIIAVKEFPAIKQRIEKINAKYAAKKEQRAAAKAEQAATAKQERIEMLQAELDELKKDE